MICLMKNPVIKFVSVLCCCFFSLRYCACCIWHSRSTSAADEAAFSWCTFTVLLSNDCTMRQLDRNITTRCDQWCKQSEKNSGKRWFERIFLVFKHPCYDFPQLHSVNGQVQLSVRALYTTVFFRNAEQWKSSDFSHRNKLGYSISNQYIRLVTIWSLGLLAVFTVYKKAHDVGILNPWICSKLNIYQPSS